MYLEPLIDERRHGETLVSFVRSAALFCPSLIGGVSQMSPLVCWLHHKEKQIQSLVKPKANQLVVLQVKANVNKSLLQGDFSFGFCFISICQS